MQLVEKADFHGLVLKQPEIEMELPENFIRNITREGKWIIAVDHSNIVSDKMFKLIQTFDRSGKNNTHFLMCARDIDWKHSKAEKLNWSSISGFNKRRLRGISATDAEKFVFAWSAFGTRGLGKLKDMDTMEAKESLLEASLGEEKREPDEGALLGAMLITRYGDELHNHVRKMLYKLHDIPLYNGTLLDAFAYIVAMHSERLNFLSKLILAKLYQCKPSDIKKKILSPLGDEAASAVSGNMIYTRHLSIALSARKILEQEFDYDFDELFIELTTVAVQAKLDGIYVEQFRNWLFNSDHFAKNNNYPLAIKLDQEILKLDNTDDYVLVHLSKLFRKAGQPDMALRLFRDINYSINRRPVFCEWALIEANENHKAESICLSAIALSDQAEKTAIDIKNACMNLYSIGFTFKELYDRYKNIVYLNAALASANLGLGIDAENRKITALLKGIQERHEIKELSPEVPAQMQSLKNGIALAEKEKGSTFKDWLPQIDMLEFNGLSALLENTRNVGLL